MLFAVIQRVKKAKIITKRNPVSEIGQGLLVLVGISTDDTDKDVDYMVKKIVNLRIFSDTRGKMNLNIQQINGEILSVSQFTLCANVHKGNRPGFDNAANPVVAERLWRKFNQLLVDDGVCVREGIFGANMEVELINYGPVTICLDSRR